MTGLEEYYNKFNEDKRLSSRHGQVEFTVTMKYIHDFLRPGDRIIDIGAGTGRYSIALFNEGYDVTAVELVQHNLGVLKQKCPEIKVLKRNAMKLNKIEDEHYDLTLLFGPLYHLPDYEDKLKALLEARRVTRPGGIIMAAYTMNEYSVLTYGFKNRHIKELWDSGKLSDDFRVVPGAEDLYDYVRLEDMDRLNNDAGLKRLKRFSPDGASDYMRRELNALSEEEFQLFIKYQLSVCERAELTGAGSHTVDILLK